MSAPPPRPTRTKLVILTRKLFSELFHGFAPLPLRVFARNEAIHKLFGRRFSSFHFGTYCLVDTVYYIGASLKDLGKKWFAFGRMESDTEGLLAKI